MRRRPRVSDAIGLVTSSMSQEVGACETLGDLCVLPANCYPLGQRNFDASEWGYGVRALQPEFEWGRGGSAGLALAEMAGEEEGSPHFYLGAHQPSAPHQLAGTCPPPQMLLSPLSLFSAPPPQAYCLDGHGLDPPYGWSESLWWSWSEGYGGACLEGRRNCRGLTY